MPAQRVLVLPGAGSPFHERWAPAYATIRSEAERRRIAYCTLEYPGQAGRQSGLLEHEGALHAVSRAGAAFRPNWIIARSYGCSVIGALLARGVDWGAHLEGVVLWGPVTGRSVDRRLPTRQHRAAEVASYAQRNTYLPADFFDTMPDLRQSIGRIASDVRLARGELDEYQMESDIDELEEAYRRGQPDRIRSRPPLPGLPHVVVSSEVSCAQLALYAACLFDPIR